MPLRQYPNRRTTVGRGPQQASLGQRVTGSARVKTSRNVKNAAKPTITGWQNYTGKTMGPVGQYSRVPGFGRTFRG